MDSPPDLTDSNDSTHSDGLSPNDLFQMSKWELMNLDTAKINWEAWNHYNLHQDSRSRLVALASTMRDSLQKHESWTIVPLMEFQSLPQKHEYISEILKLKKLEERRAANQHIDNWMKFAYIQAKRNHKSSIGDHFILVSYWIRKSNRMDYDCPWPVRWYRENQFKDKKEKSNYFYNLRTWHDNIPINDIFLLKVFVYTAESYQQCKETIYAASTKWMIENDCDDIEKWVESVDQKWYLEQWKHTSKLTISIKCDIYDTMYRIGRVGWARLMNILSVLSQYYADPLVSEVWPICKNTLNLMFDSYYFDEKLLDTEFECPPIESIKDELITAINTYLLREDNNLWGIHEYYIREFVKYLELH